MLLEKGDIFATCGPGKLSRAIRFFSKGIGESRTLVNHVGLIVETGKKLPDTKIIEALSRVKHHKFKDQYTKGKTLIYILKPTELSPSQRSQICKQAEKQIGKKYGYIKIVAHFLDWTLFGAHVFRRLTQMKRYPICSWLVADAYKTVGLDFGVKVSIAEPDDIMDFALKNSNKYEILGPYKCQ